MALEPNLTVYVSLDLLSWHQEGVLVLSPKFQRRSVWSPGARSYFIDTLLQGYPVPPLHLRMVRKAERGVIREVVDGQQRLRALFDFIEGKFRLSGALDASWAGKSYQQLSNVERDRIEEYKFQIFQYQNIDDEVVLQIFSRINTNSIPLNAQELRNGRFFGEFKQSVYKLAFQHLAFWRDGGVFSEGAIARMREAELVSELLIVQLDGLQDKKNTVNDFYRNLDEDWGTESDPWTNKARTVPRVWHSRKVSEKRFASVMEALRESTGDTLSQSEFRRVPLFYTLYCAMYHRIYGIPGLDLVTPKKPLSDQDQLQLRVALEKLSDLVSEKPKVEDLRGWRRDFLVAAARQTDNVGPRRERLRVLWEQAELAG